MARHTQAILPLRGKILNIEKAPPERIYKNTELQALIAALGLGVAGAAFDAAALRYGRVIIMTDADVDGAHIRVLLLTFFWRYQRELITEGHVHIACPPLYKLVARRGKTEYAWSDEELDARCAELGGSREKLQVQRFKGLGEMMPQQLWETTMNPETRMLKKVTAEDAAHADQVLRLLMGDSVMPRKEFIAANAQDMTAAELDF